MSYTALYRRLRPQNFDSVVGQSHIVRTLKNQLNSNRISHAYLFCGTRGTGKTTTAKIFAKALNCLDAKDGEPCNNCRSCKDILSQSDLNVIEIDAASNNGVDNIRDIREEVKYPPANAKYKVYIIDEVHMLSAGAFNALLKTLEEPPEHVIFILATTDPQKVPATIHSRCQRLDFKRITSQDMVNALENYMAEEKVEVEDDALKYVARLSDGAMRDALSLLDQCISFYSQEKITLEKVLDITGSVDNAVFFEMAGALKEFDSRKCIDIINKVVVDGRDLGQFLSEFIVHLRNILVASNAGYSAVDVAEDTGRKYEEQGKSIDKEMIINYINVFSELQNKMKYSFNERVVLETACIKLCNPPVSAEGRGNDSMLLKRISDLENMIKSGALPSQPSQETEKKTVNKAAVKQKPKAVPEDINTVIGSWKAFVSGFEEPVKALLTQSFAGYLEGEVLYIVAPNPTVLKLLRNKEEEIAASLSGKFGKEFKVTYILKDDYDLRHKNEYGAVDENSKEKAFDEDAYLDKLNGFAQFD